MRNRSGPLIACLVFAVLLVASSATAAQSNVGFAAYKVVVTTSSGQHSVLVNESVSHSAKLGFSDLVLQLTGSRQNLTYSRLVNSSSHLFPLLSNLASQSLDYGNGTISGVHANLSAAGSATVSFQGSQYTLAVYTFALSAARGNMSFAVNGTLETFPSSLVYSVSASGGAANFEAVLQATNLQLTQSPNSASTVAYVGAGVGVGGIALGAAFLVRRRERKTASKEQKPLHWVD